MAGGRPRTVSLPPDEMIALGEEMLKWVKENDPNHLTQWYYGVKHFVYKDWEDYIRMPEFRRYYEESMAFIGQKYLKKDTAIEPSLKHRFLRLYFTDIRKREDADADAQVERESRKALSKDEINVKDEQIKELENELMLIKAKLKKETDGFCN